MAIPAAAGQAEGVYKRLTALHKEGAVSFKHCATFNLDEYVGLSPELKEAYSQAAVMWRGFFSVVDILREVRTPIAISMRHQ